MVSKHNITILGLVGVCTAQGIIVGVVETSSVEAQTKLNLVLINFSLGVPNILEALTELLIQVE